VGHEIIETQGLIRGNTVRARNVGRDITRGLWNLAGGDLKAYTTLMSDAREEPSSGWRPRPRNAAPTGRRRPVLTAEVTRGVTEILAHGSAVRLD
jgi:uncharacterized protein YbjQ (UPF0145 family)